MDFLLSYKKQVDIFLRDYLTQKRHSLPGLLKKDADLIDNLLNFSLRGKMVRGGLVLFSHDLLGGNNKKEAIKVASAVELFHSSLLIHDDIIDNDRLRRGKESIWQLYAKIQKSDHFGRSIAICVGDLGFFLGFDIISTLDLNNQLKVELTNLFSRELMLVTMAQAQDIKAGFSKLYPTKKEIESIYRYKTARYTFSLPFTIGAILAGNKIIIKKLDELGENLGILYQIKDDELGLFGDSSQTGKPVDNDLIEKKKTLILCYLFEYVTSLQKKKLTAILSQQNITKKDIVYIKDLIQKSPVRKVVADLMNDLAVKAKKSINSLNIKNSGKKSLYNLVEFCLNRNR